MNDTLQNPTRRTVLRTIVATTATAGLAGCIGDSGASDGGGNQPTRDPNESYVESEPDYAGWFDDVDNYSGTVDRRGREGVTVAVGAGSRGMDFAPAAVMVSPGTVIRWEWTGNGETHNVSEQNGQFKSEFSSSAGHTFEHAFQVSGINKYVCEPHRSMGMKGAIVVEE